MRKVLLAFVYTVFIASLTAACSGERPGEDETFSGGASSRLPQLLGAGDTAGYALALESRPFDFPHDHGPHPEYRNEWWYLTGNLDAADGRRFGFELTIFRFSLIPMRQHQVRQQASAWSTNQLYIGHFAVTDVAARSFHVAERYARGAVGLADAATAPVRVHVEDWRLEHVDGRDDWRLRAAEGAIELSLSLRALKAPVLNGIDGLSQKSAQAGNASYYYSIPRLRAEGSLAIGGERHDVTGLAWMDREWSSSALAQDQEGWDWFALQLADGSDLMYYQLRTTGGQPDRHSAGTWMPERGDSVPLERDDVSIRVRHYWDSPRGGRYPMGWTLEVPRLALELEVDPVLEDQELSTALRYWEGAVDVSGSRQGRPLQGRGYVELTGYADPE